MNSSVILGYELIQLANSCAENVFFFLRISWGYNSSSCNMSESLEIYFVMWHVCSV